MVWVAGLAGMIISSVNGNNNGWVVTCGGITAVGSVCLFTATAAARRERIDVFEEADAERLEQHVERLVSAGADEAAVRDLVREALRLGRGRGASRA